MLLFVLVAVIVITMCLVLIKNKQKTSNFSSNIYQSNTQIRCTENEDFSDSGSVTTHTNAAYKTSQPPLDDRLDVVYDTVIEQSSPKEGDPKLTVKQKEAYESSNFPLSPNVSYAPLKRQASNINTDYYIIM